MNNIETVAEVKRRLVSRGLLKPCSFDDMYAEQNNVMNHFIRLFPKTGQALFSYWLGEYSDPSIGIYETQDPTQYIRKTYHNRAHILTALDRFFSTAVKRACPDRGIRSERVVALTLLLHDVYHSQGQYDDSANIARVLPLFTVPINGDWRHYPVFYAAGVTLEDFLDDLHLENARRLDEIMGQCRWLVMESEYPYNREPTTLGGILRDIDRLALLSRDYFEEVYEGLFAEMNTRLGYTDFLSFCRNQIRFMKSFEWHNKGLKQELTDSPQMVEAELLTYLVYHVAREVASEQFDGY